MFVGGTVAFPFSSVKSVSDFSVLSTTVTDISLTGAFSPSVIVTVIRFSIAMTDVSGNFTFSFPSAIVIKAFSTGFVSSVTRTL